MANANVIEIETCLKEALKFCEEHQDLEFIRHYHPRLERAKKLFEDAVKASDHHWIQWQKESQEDKVVWKHMANEYLAAQRALVRQNAVGYPNVRVRHWDEEALLGYVEEMIAYLDEHKADIEDATAMSEKLQRLVGKALKENKDESEAFKNYQRYATQRSNAFGVIGSALWEFRGAMRRHYGKRNPTYLSIRWPLTLNSDETVL